MGRVMMAGDDDCPALAGNVQKARKSWGRMSRVLIREGAYRKVSGHFFKAVVQAVLLFGAEMWVLTRRMERDLNIFQQKGHATAHREAVEKAGGWKLGLPFAGGDNGRRRL